MVFGGICIVVCCAYVSIGKHRAFVALSRLLPERDDSREGVITHAGNVELQGGVHALIGRSIVLDLKIPASLENALAG